MQIVYNAHDIRAKKARFGRLFHKKLTRKLMWVVVVGATIAGILLPVADIQIGILLIIPALAISMALLWWYGDLRDLPATLNTDQDMLLIHKALDRRVLAKLKGENPSPMDIWKAVKGSWRQQFFLIRFGIDPGLFEESLSQNPKDSAALWQKADELAIAEHQQGITAATLTVAILNTLPNHETYLNHLGLESEDLLAGIDWQHHIELVGRRYRKKESFGGIARDWSAGYTPYLNRLGRNMSSEIQFDGGLLYRDTDAHAQSVDQIIKILSKPGNKNVVLVGDVGVGKTTTVYSFAQSLLLSPNVPRQLKYRQVVSLNAAMIISHVGDQGSLEDLMLRVMSEAVRAKNIILFFDEAQLFFNQGTGSVDLSNIIVPALEGNALSTIFAMPPRQWEKIKAQNPSLAGLMNPQTIQPPNEQDTMSIMEDQVLRTEHQQGVRFMYQALREAYRLADHYEQDVVFPGKALRLLDSATSHAENGLITAQSVQSTVEATLGVKVQAAGREEKAQLLELEDKIHERMINQTRAVKVVSDALRRSRSGVGNPNRPIGTFMFLGPTGVGKTELAKALAGVYFSGEDQIVRVNMNEFIRSKDIRRLLAPTAKTGTSFLSKIRKQPFSVVLFDEIEKAHPDIINVLLQLLDEGKIKDTDNREASFRDAIIIATSNAGATEIRSRIEAGESLEDFEEAFVNQLIESGQFKPELLNRFDEIVLFRPLTPDELVEIVDLLIVGVNKTLNRQKISVTLTKEAKLWLVQKGYDPRLGARPMRRMVQRTVENIVAKRLLQSETTPGQVIQLDVVDLEKSS